MRSATVLLGHGSRRGSATDEGLQEICAQVQRVLGPLHPVLLAGWEFTQPSLPDVLAQLARRRVEAVVVAPVFLFDGRHIVEEIPELLEAESRRYPGLHIVLARTLGLDPRLISLAVRRVEEAVAGRTCPRHPCSCAQSRFGPELGVVVVNRGSRRQYDPGLRLRQIAALVAVEMGGSVPVAHAQAEYEEPTVQQAVDHLVHQGARRVIVLPYLLFPGKVTEDNIRPAVLEAQRAHPDLEIQLARTLGPAQEVAEVVCDRALEAWGRLTLGADHGAGCSH